MPRGVPKKAAKSGQVTRAELIRQTAKKLGKTMQAQGHYCRPEGARCHRFTFPCDQDAEEGRFGAEKAHGTKAAAAKHSAGQENRRYRRNEQWRRSGQQGPTDSGRGQIARQENSPRDVIAELAKEGITVSSAQVSTTLSAAGYRRKHRGNKAAGSAPTGEHKWFHCGSAACGQGVRAEGRRE